MVHIKRVVIQGLKSYKEQTVFDNFHQRVNVIVGKNGSGKSNFFFALRFVLSDMFTNLRPEDRQRLLHEGGGDTVLSGFVEIHFDNSDNRFPIDKDEVILRRSIGLKKDEYFLDQKRVTKHDIVNLLESAGFSRSNPYYIVQQGRVNALALMKESERLDLLKEIAGTNVYDERKEESLKIMKESESKREKIGETLNYIEERLHELEDEKEELKEYQKLDKQRRALEYTIYDKELAQTAESLEEVEQERARESDRASVIHSRAVEAHESVRKAEKDIRTLSTEILQATKEKELAEEEKQDLFKERAVLELNVTDSERKIKRETEMNSSFSKELKSLEKGVKRTQKDLDNVRPEFDNISQKEREENEKLMDCNRRMNELYSKQGRSSQFRTKKERDAFLKDEIKQVEQQATTKREQITAIEKEIEETRSGMEEESAEIEHTTAQIEERKQQIEQINRDLNTLKRSRDDLFNGRKDLWRRDSEMDANLQHYKNELVKSERQLQSSVSKVISSGLQAVKRITVEHNITGVYGPLIELFECDEQFMTAVEVTAGNSLFFVVVDTDSTAAKILGILNKEKVGRVTFIPLNQLFAKDPEYPESPDVRPMIEQLRFKPMFRKAFQQIFGKTLICRSIEVAASFARSHDLDCITLDGDQVNRKGALTGGFYDVRHSRLEAMKKIKQWRSKIDSISDDAKKIKTSLADFDQKVSSLLGEVQKLESERNSVRDTYEQMTLETKTSQKDVSTQREVLQQKEQMHATLSVSLKQLEETIRSLRSEIGTELLSQLSDDEKAELLQLNETMAELKQSLIETSTARAELESRKATLENQLANNLLKRKEQIQERLESLRLEEQSMELDQNSRQLENVKSSITEVTSRSKELAKNIEEKKSQISQLEESIEQMKAAENQEARALQSESESMEKLLNKRSLLLQKKEDCERKIREIGSLPTAEVEAEKQKTLKQLMKALHTTHQQLKDYSHVNKKALDQYVQFTEQRDKLLSRKEELDKGAESIAELIQFLDKKKDEAIERTFKGVSKSFKDVFQELVPGGDARLIMRGGKTVNELTGVKTVVSFSGGGESHTIEQLSGGQKSLVALALIFAIQRCDPAPFYLFDEIDSALDTTYRHAVGQMIRKQSKTKSKEGTTSVQFIVSTFKPEFLQISDKCYAVSLRHKASNIAVVPKEDALKVIQEEQDQQDMEED